MFCAHAGACLGAQLACVVRVQVRGAGYRHAQRPHNVY